MNGNSNLNNNVAPVNLEQPTPVTPNQGVQRPSVVTIPEAMLTVNHDETPVTPVQEPVQNAPQNVNTINKVNTQAQTGNVNQIVPPSVEAINNDDYSFSNYKVEIEENSYLTPFIVMIPMQLIAYEVARIKGYDIDKPRNLAKSVTVE